MATNDRDDRPERTSQEFRRVLSRILALDRADGVPSEGASALGERSTILASDDEARSLDEARDEREPGLPERFGRYVVLGTLGRGGMGVVLEAFDRTLDRKVAVKLLHHHLAERHGERLIREAKALARLSHPHVVQVHEVGTLGEQAFVAMERVEGQTLDRWQRERRSWRESVDVYLQAGRGLAAAHAKELVHRDFKPSNCILDGEGRVRVLDFGLVRALDESDEPVGSSDEEEDAPKLDGDASLDGATTTGTVLGTLAYMAPEQMRGEPVDARADQFSFCVALYEVLYGERPFVGKTLAELAEALQSGQLRPVPDGRGVPAGIGAAVVRGLAVRPEDRWPSMDELLAQLERRVRPRWTWWTMALVVLLAGLVIGSALWHQSLVGRVCSGAREQLAGVWDDERRRQVQAAILGTEVPYAGDTWERVEQRLDDYTRAWADEYTEVCEATNVRKEQSAEVMDLRMGCLHDRRIALLEAVDVLAEANPARVQAAVLLVSNLRDFASCADERALRATVPPPDDPEAAEAVQWQRQQLVRADVLRSTGEYAQSRALAEAVARRADALGYHPLRAEAGLRLGLASMREGQYEQAEEHLERAAWLAVEHGHHAVEAEAAALLAYVVGYRGGRHAQGRHWGQQALHRSRGARVEPRIEALALSGLGGVAQGRGDYEEALSRYREAMDMRQRDLGAQHPDVARLWGNIGVVLSSLGRNEEALTHHQRALSLFEEALGPRHPDVAMTLGNIGLVFDALGRLDDALDAFRRALSIRIETLGARHPGVAGMLDRIGRVREHQGALADARARYQRALDIREEKFGPRSPAVAESLDRLGVVSAKQGELSAALDHYRRALEIREAVLEPRARQIATSLSNIGEVLCTLDRSQEALEHHERALEIKRETYGEHHREVARSLHHIGLVYVGLGQLDEALGYLRRALKINQDVLGERHPAVARATSDIGHTLFLQGNLSEALEHQRRALALFEEHGGAAVAYALVGLANVSLALGDVSAAREHAERALTIRLASEVAPADLAKARFSLARSLWPEPTVSVEPPERARARALAQQARDDYAALDGSYRDDQARVEAWLSARSSG